MPDAKRKVGRPRGSVDRTSAARDAPTYSYAHDVMASEVGHAIRTLRERMNVSAEELGDRLGVSKYTIWSWERGVATPSLANLLRVATSLGCRVSSLVEEV